MTLDRTPSLIAALSPYQEGGSSSDSALDEHQYSAFPPCVKLPHVCTTLGVRMWIRPRLAEMRKMAIIDVMFSGANRPDEVSELPHNGGVDTQRR